MNLNLHRWSSMEQHGLIKVHRSINILLLHARHMYHWIKIEQHWLTLWCVINIDHYNGLTIVQHSINFDQLWLTNTTVMCTYMHDDYTCLSNWVQSMAQICICIDSSFLPTFLASCTRFLDCVTISVEAWHSQKLRVDDFFTCSSKQSKVTASRRILEKMGN